MEIHKIHALFMPANTTSRLLLWLSGKESACQAKDTGLSLGQEDPLRKAISSSILAWRIPWAEERGGLQSMVSQKSQDTSE